MIKIFLTWLKGIIMNRRTPVAREMAEVEKAAERAEAKRPPAPEDALAAIEDARKALEDLRVAHMNVSKAEADLARAEAAIRGYVSDVKSAEEKFLGV